MSDRDSSIRRDPLGPSAADTSESKPKPLRDTSAQPASSEPAAKPRDGLLDHFVRRTDNRYDGVEDASLVGEDIGDETVDENGDPLES